MGHADRDNSVGRAFELEVSKKRANAVRDAMAKALQRSVGAQAARIKFVPNGLGSKELKHPNATTEAQRLENRRVLIQTKL